MAYSPATVKAATSGDCGEWMGMRGLGMSMAAATVKIPASYKSTGMAAAMAMAL